MAIQMTVKLVKELPDGSAIVTIDMNEETKEYLIGEGFLATIKRAVDTSESKVPDDVLFDVPLPTTKKRKSK